VNILLFHQHFNTPAQGGAIRSYYLAAALVQHGHRAVVITSCACTKGRTETIDGIEVIYLPIPYNNRFSFYARAWSFLRFVVGSILATRPYRNFDLCYVISAPLTVALCGRWMKLRYGIPYWFEVGDLWPDAPIQLGYVKNPLVKRWLYAFERSVYEKAAGVVALSEPIRDAILHKSPGARVEVIPNMADCKFYLPEARDKDMEARVEAMDKFVVSYIGALGVANGLHQLLDASEACLREKLPVRFIICGDGAMIDSLKEEASRRKLNNVSFTGFVNRDGVKTIMSVTDAVFISYLPAPILETGCPNKYFDGLASGKLVIVNFGGWIRREIEAANCGFYVDPKNSVDMAHKLRPYISDGSKLESAKFQARKLAETRYERAAVSDRFARIFVDS